MLADEPKTGSSGGVELPVLELSGISKAFGGVHALSEVSVSVAPGQVHAVVGENGAGKSTLMKIIAGALQPDSGSISIAGEATSFRGPKEAADRGIAIVYQEPTYFAELSVLENFYVGDELTSTGGIIRWDAMSREAARALEEMELPPSLMSRRMSELSIGTQQLVLIAKGIHKRAKLLILDEPTSILSQAETDTLFRTIKKLRAQGVSVLYISHRIQEIFEISDHITVLRDGKKVRDMPTSDATEALLVKAMTGRELSSGEFDRPDYSGREVVLAARGLGATGYFVNVSFDLHPGQILGVYGLVGAGRTEMATAIVGEMPRDAGEVELFGKQFNPSGIAEAMDQGLVYLPEDRNTQGLFLIRSIRDNLSAGLLKQMTRSLGLVDREKERARTGEQVGVLKIKTDSQENPVKSLSGGNQQKVVLARGLMHKPKVLILDEPTRGIDVGTKQEIHKLIVELARQNLAVLLISSDLPEVLSVADSVMVMHEGEVMGSFGREDATEERIVKLALGLKE